MDGDERAWQELCEQHVAGVRAVAHARLRDHHAAEDVVQETMLRAWTRLHQLTDVTRFGAWLKTIAANVAVDHVRRQRATAPLAAAHDRPAALPSHDEVGMTTGSVRVLLSRARRQVRDGYGLVVAPLVVLLARWRTRWAGLGDAVPLAIAAPAAVVVVVAGVVTSPEPTAPPPEPTTSVAVAPTPTPTPLATTDPTPTATTSGAAPAPTTTPLTARPTVVSSAPLSTDPSTGAGVDVLGGSVRFRDEPPTEDDEDASTPGAPTGPVEGIELYLEDTGLGDLGLGDLGLGDPSESCLFCG